jgi:hypothetical protein
LEARLFDYEDWSDASARPHTGNGEIDARAAIGVALPI